MTYKENFGIKFEDKILEDAYNEYLGVRKKLGRTKPVCLMDIATLAVKYLKKHDFTSFGYYRIILGILVIILLEKLNHTKGIIGSILVIILYILEV